MMSLEDFLSSYGYKIVEDRTGLPCLSYTYEALQKMWDEYQLSQSRAKVMNNLRDAGMLDSDDNLIDLTDVRDSRGNPVTTGYTIAAVNPPVTSVAEKLADRITKLEERTSAQEFRISKQKNQILDLEEELASLRRIVNPAYHSDVCLYPCFTDHGDDYINDRPSVRMPWSEPGHDILGDIQEAMRRAELESQYRRY